MSDIVPPPPPSSKSSSSGSGTVVRRLDGGEQNEIGSQDISQLLGDSASESSNEPYVTGADRRAGETSMEVDRENEKAIEAKKASKYQELASHQARNTHARLTAALSGVPQATAEIRRQVEARARYAESLKKKRVDGSRSNAAARFYLQDGTLEEPPRVLPGQQAPHEYFAKMFELNPVPDFVLNALKRTASLPSGYCRLCCEFGHVFKDCPFLKADGEDRRDRCTYKYCDDKKDHDTRYCPVLNNRCENCFRRGHKIETNVCLQFEETYMAFEMFRESGFLTKKSDGKLGTLFSYFPVLEVSVAQMLDALGGHAHLKSLVKENGDQSDAEQLIDRLSRIEKESSQCEPFYTEYVLREGKKSESKRTRDARSHSAGPPPKRAQGGNNNRGGRGGYGSGRGGLQGHGKGKSGFRGGSKKGRKHTQ